MSIQIPLAFLHDRPVELKLFGCHGDSDYNEQVCRVNGVDGESRRESSHANMARTNFSFPMCLRTRAP